MTTINSVIRPNRLVMYSRYTQLCFEDFFPHIDFCTGVFFSQTLADQEPVNMKHLETLKPLDHLCLVVRSVWPETLLVRSHRYRFQNIAAF